MGCKRAFIVSSVAIMVVVAICWSPVYALEVSDWVGTWHKLKLKLKNVCELDGFEPLYKIKSGGPAWMHIIDWDGGDTYRAVLMLETGDGQWIPGRFTLTLTDGTAADGLLQSSNILFIDNDIGEEIELSFVVRLKGKEKDGVLKSGKMNHVVGLARLKYPFAECVASMTSSGELKKENKVPQKVIAARNYSKIFTIATEMAECSSKTTMPPRAGIGSDGTNFLVVTHREDYSPEGLIGVLFSPRGEILKEFVISPHKLGFTAPSVDFDGTNYMVVYGDSGDIKGIRVSAAGAVLDIDGGFKISNDNYNEMMPSVKFDGTRFLVAWSKSDGRSYDVYGSFITPDAQATPPFPISSADNSQTWVDLEFDGNNFFAVWVDSRNTITYSDHPDLYGARISTAGEVLDPDGIPIATSDTSQGSPQIAFDGSNYMVMWMDVEKPGFSPPIANVYGKRIRPDGTLMDGIPESNGIVINSIQEGKWHPTLTFDGTNFFATWTVGAYPINPPAGIYSARISSSGNLIGASANSLGVPITGLPPESAKLVNASSMFNGSDLIVTWVVSQQGWEDTCSKWVEGRFIYFY